MNLFAVLAQNNFVANLVVAILLMASLFSWYLIFSKTCISQKQQTYCSAATRKHTRAQYHPDCAMATTEHPHCAVPPNTTKNSYSNLSDRISRSRRGADSQESARYMGGGCGETHPLLLSPVCWPC